MIWRPHPWTVLGDQRRVRRNAVLAIYHTSTRHWRAWIKLNAASVMYSWGIE